MKNKDVILISYLLLLCILLLAYPQRNRKKELYRFNFSRSKWEQIIEEWIFNEDDRNITKKWLLDGKTMEEIAECYNVSVQNVKKRIYEAHEIILRSIKK